MYQIVIRILAPQLPVFDFSLGQIIDGQFHPADVKLLPDDVLKNIQISELLGTQAYVQANQLSAVVSVLSNAGASIQFYPNFIVFSLSENYVTEKEKDS